MKLPLWVQRFSDLPPYLKGLWLVGGSAFVLAVASLGHAWQRPVSALSGIGGYSDIFDVMSGAILKQPGGRYRDVDMRPGDQIVQFEGVPWAYAQRLNLHELPVKPAGAWLDIVVQRGETPVALRLRLTRPDWWEQLVLARYGIGALALLATPTLLLWSLSNDVLERPHIRETLAVERNSLPLFILLWQGVAIAQGMASLKYPVAFLCTDVLTPLLAGLAGITSLPYPLAPPHMRPRWFERGLLVLVLGAMGALLWQAARLPVATTDWRWSVQLLRPNDLVWRATWIPNLIGVAAAVVGIFATALVRPASQGLRWTGGTTPSWWQRGTIAWASWLEQRYVRCPTSIRVIAEFQLTIITLYMLLDVLPRLAGGQGGGYSSLFAAIPISYLLLYSDTQAQQYGRILTRALLLATVVIQGVHNSYRLIIGRYGMGATVVDLTTVVLFAVGTLGGGFGIGIDQWFRRRRAVPDTSALDDLFTRETPEAFWQHLTGEVGRHIGVYDWLWLERLERDVGERSPQRWQITWQTEGTQARWIDDPGVQWALERLTATHTQNVTADATVDLPATLVLLPIYRNDHLSEVLIAVNPQWHAGALQVESPLILGRLMQAVNVLRSRERERAIATQQRALAEERGALIERYRQVTSEQRRDTFQANLRFSGLIHDTSVPQLAILLQDIAQQQQSAPPEQQPGFVLLEERARAIEGELRRIARELRPPGVGQQLRYALEHLVMEWEQQHPVIQFEYRFTADEQWLSEFQRDTIYMIVQQLGENALKHAAALVIEIQAFDQEQNLVVEVNDNGRGFAPDAIRPDALGILTRNDMARDMGGTLTITTRPGAGCRVRLVVPHPVLREEGA